MPVIDRPTFELDALRAGGKASLSRALAELERDPQAPHVLALLDAAYAAPLGHVVGVTGPPGVGKSTLLGALIAELRRRGRTVAVIAVDPSSRRSGGALLGDRVRLATDPEDQGIFVRSMAARDRLGGLADITVAAMVLMRALYDVVLIETVGVGQSETDVVGAADTVVFCVQPGSGDSLQFMKAGIVEIPHVIVVNKADMGAAAQRALSDLKGALSLNSTGPADWPVAVLALAAQQGRGLAELIEALDRHFAWLGTTGLPAARRAQAQDWLQEALRERFGRDGLKRLEALGKSVDLAPEQRPFAHLEELSQILAAR